MKPLRLVTMFSVALVSLTILLASCAKEIKTPYYGIPDVNNVSPVELYLTAVSSSSAYSSLKLDLQSVEYNESAENGISTGWEAIEIEQPGIYEISGLLNGRSMRLTSNLVPGNVKQIRLHIGNNNSIEKEGKVEPIGISNEILENGITINTYNYATGYEGPIWLNIDIPNSIMYNPADNEFSLVPSVKSFDFNRTGSIEGYATPGDAMPRIHVEADPGSRIDFTSSESVAESANDGYFKFVGLPEGIYQVEITAADGTERKLIITTVEVKNGQTNNIGSHEIQ